MKKSIKSYVKKATNIIFFFGQILLLAFLIDSYRGRGFLIWILIQIIWGSWWAYHNYTMLENIANGLANQLLENKKNGRKKQRKNKK